VSDPLLDSIRRAVQAAPGDHPLRLHLAELLLADGQSGAAVGECATVLAQDPANAAARALMLSAMGTPPAARAESVPSGEPQAPVVPSEPVGPDEPAAATEEAAPQGFDWNAAEQEVGEIAAPMFVEEDAAGEPSTSAWEVETAGVTLADVGGMQQVKERLEAAFLAPMRNPELRKLYGKSLRGGLLLYGPPGCGKTFIARAVAGELGARFVSVGLADVLDMYIGNSERNIAELFGLVRREAPCVLFLDEIDALGQKRSSTRNTAMRGAVNQLLTELDGVGDVNEGVFVLAATNQPWDVDPALRRPGRLDRTLLVLPPDAEARESIFRYHLRHRPVEGIDLRRLAKATDGFSGADVAHVCETAAERALIDSARSGQVRLIGMADLEGALKEIRPSIGGWLDTARNVVLFADDDGTYADLRTYLKKAKRL
jgi:SpoVK/Ycf46/Vps4 family AAA+-type ATPase